MKNLEEYIFESNGEYSDQHKITEYLSNLILNDKKNKIKLKYDDLKKIDNIFFEQLILTYEINDDISGDIIGFSDSKNDGSYKNETDELQRLFKEYNFNSKTKKLYSINIINMKI